jgi:hypothetical protein
MNSNNDNNEEYSRPDKGKEEEEAVDPIHQMLMGER